jgi:hypothetical protein
MTSKINETTVGSSDVNSIFKAAVKANNTPSGLGRVFKGLRKDQIDLTDLQDAWANYPGEAYPKDLRDISAILKNVGFDDKSIKKVYTSVLGKDKKSGSYKTPVGSEAVVSIVAYIQKSGIKNEVMDFMKKEFGYKPITESVSYEDVRRIFTEIVIEERTERPNLIREEDKRLLGRAKK